MINVLVPIDFSISSLNIIHNVVAKYPGEKIAVYLVHALKSGNGISDLLFINRRLNVSNLYEQDFIDACEMIKNKYESVIAKIKIEMYYGESRKYLKSFLEHREIAAVFFTKNYTLNSLSDRSRDMYSLFDKVDIPVYHETVDLTKMRKIQEQKLVQEDIMV